MRPFAFARIEEAKRRKGNVGELEIDMRQRRFILRIPIRAQLRSENAHDRKAPPEVGIQPRGIGKSELDGDPVFQLDADEGAEPYR